MASLSWLIIMNTRDELFFKALGARIARARKAHGLTQKQLAHTMGIAQQTLAHYEVGRARLPASMLPILTRLLTVSLEELIDLPAPRIAPDTPDPVYPNLASIYDPDLDTAARAAQRERRADDGRQANMFQRVFGFGHSVDGGAAGGF